MQPIRDILVYLSGLLYPIGRAFRFFSAKWLPRLHNALAKSEADAVSSAHAVMFTILPDNDNFTESDAAQWERRLGLISSTGATLEQRKAAIIRKYNHPGVIPGRQARVYMEGMLRMAGFEVRVWRNKFNGAALSPDQKLATQHGPNHEWLQYQYAVNVDGGEINDADSTKQLMEAIYGPYITTEHGVDTPHGDTGDIIIDYLEAEKDREKYDAFLATKTEADNLEPFYRLTFFVTGDDFEAADIPEGRRKEFRQLLLLLMPTNMIGFIYVRYV